MMCAWWSICARSLRCSTIEIWVSRVVLTANFQSYNARVINYDRKAFIRLDIVKIWYKGRPIYSLKMIDCANFWPSNILVFLCNRQLDWYRHFLFQHQFIRFDIRYRYRLEMRKANNIWCCWHRIYSRRIRMIQTNESTLRMRSIPEWKQARQKI